MQEGISLNREHELRRKLKMQSGKGPNAPILLWLASPQAEMLQLNELVDYGGTAWT